MPQITSNIFNLASASSGVPPENNNVILVDREIVIGKNLPCMSIVKSLTARSRKEVFV